MESLTIEKDEKYLRQISKKVNFPDKELDSDIKILEDFCIGHSCFAMAAVQLSVPKRIVYVKSTTLDSTNEDSCSKMLLINPEIISKKGKTEYWEACVSGLTNFALVERPYEIVIKYQDRTGKTLNQKFEGFVSTILSHELDHLDGILHMDRAKQLLQMDREERVLWRQKHPYKIISKDCKFEYLEK